MGIAVVEKMLDFSDKGGLFEHFEVNSEPFWPKVSRLIGGSAALHVVLAACIIFIPPVRSALSIVSFFSGGKFVDRPYNKTQIENGDILELTTEKFHYPEGYFATDQQAMPSPTPPFPTAFPFIPKNVPPSQLVGPSPTPAPSPVASPSAAIAANASPAQKTEEQKAAEKAEQELDRAAAENGVKRPKEINTRPFKDLLVNAKKMKEDGKLNLDGQIELTVEADRDPDGKLKNAQVKDKRGDKMLEAVALDLVSALSDSGVLDFLEGTRHLRLTAKLDDKNVEITASTEVESEDRARQMEKGYSLLIVGGRIAKRGKDEEVYYNHTVVTSKDKEVSVKFSISRDEMSQLLTKYSAEK